MISSGLPCALSCAITLEPKLFGGAGKCFAQRVFQHQPGRQFELVPILLQELDERPGELAPVHGVRNAEMTVDFVDFFIPVMEGMIVFADVMPCSESIDEADADAAVEILHRVFFFRLAMLEHFLPGKTAPEPCRRRFHGMNSPQQSAEKRQCRGFHWNCSPRRGKYSGALL